MNRNAPVFTIFSEARLEDRGVDGVQTTNAAISGRGWGRGLEDVPGARFAARVGPSTGAPVFPLEGTTTVALPYYVGKGQMVKQALPLFMAVSKAVRESDAVLVRMPGFVGWCAAAACVVWQTPYAVEVVGDIDEVLRAGVGGSLLRRVARVSAGVTRIVVRRARVVRYVTASSLQNSYPAHASVPTFSFSSVVLPLSWVTDAPSKEKDLVPTVLLVGSQEQNYKGHDVAIQAMSVVVEAFPNARLVILGEGRLQTEYRQLATSLGIAANVDFVGYVSSRQELLERLDSSWLFLMPSRTEGLPRALVEAMSRRLPCIGSDLGGIAELLTEDCLIAIDDHVTLADKVIQLLSDPHLRQELGSVNHKRAHAFTDPELAPQRIQWLSSVTNLVNDERQKNRPL